MKLFEYRNERERSRLFWRVQKIPGRSPYSKPFSVCAALCRAYREGEQTAVHILLQRSGMPNYRTKYLGMSKSLPEVFNKPEKEDAEILGGALVPQVGSSPTTR